MNSISFFTPVTYQTPTLLGIVDDYFYLELWGKKAHVIEDGKVVVSEARASTAGKIAKFISYFSLVVPFVMLVAKAALRSVYAFKVIDAREELEKGITISETTLSKIQRLMPDILSLKDHDEIIWLSKGGNAVFKLKDSSQQVYKVAKSPVNRDNIEITPNQLTEERFANMIKAKEVCLANHLGLLVIPHAKKFDVTHDGKNYTFIAEELLNLTNDGTIQEESYHTYAHSLTEAIRQLTVFIAKTGYSDVIWRNIPLINEKEGFIGPRRIALIDLEHFQDIVRGLFGDASNGSKGLIYSVGKDQIDVVINEVKKQGLTIDSADLERAKAYRLEELKKDASLRAFHLKNGIKTGKEPLDIDLNTLGLDLTEESNGFTLGKVAEVVVAAINKYIANTSSTASLKYQRDFLLWGDSWSSYTRLGLPPHTLIFDHNKKQLWMARILQALVDKGHIFSFSNGGIEYGIQA